jgi:hypothetical protein
MAAKGEKITWIILGIILLYLVWTFLFPGRLGASLGVHTGVVTAVEYNSNIIWSANIVYFKTVRESSQEDRYCVNDEGIKNQLIEAQKNKTEVTIYFKNDFIMWKWQCNGGETIIYKVE